MKPLLLSTRARTLAAVAALLAVIVAGEVWLTIARERSSSEKQVRVLARITSQTLTRQIERLAMHRDRAGIESLVAALAKHPDFDSAVLLDSSGTVVAATQLAWRGLPLAQTPLAAYAATLAETRATARTVLREVAHSSRVVTASPLVLEWRGEPLAPGGPGVLLMVFDLSAEIRAGRELALRYGLAVAAISLVGGLLLWWMLESRVTRPAEKLADAAARLAAGDRTARSGVSGSHELGRIGVAFDRMAERLEAAERERTRAGALLDALLGSLPVGVCAVDRESQRILFANRRWAEILGITDPAALDTLPEMVRGHQFQGPDGSPYEFPEMPIQRVRRTGQVAEVTDLVVVHEGGERVPLYVIAIPVSLAGRGFDTVLSVIQDRRDLDRAYRDLRESDERFASAALATGQVVYEWDFATDVIRFSGHVEAVLGHTAQALETNAKWNPSTHPEDLPALRAEMKAATREGRMFDASYRFRHGEGRWIWLHDRGIIHRDASGSPQRMIGAVADVTAQRAIEQQLIHAQRLETVGTLAGGIAHDFNNQLTGVIGYLDFVRGQVPASSPLLDPLTEARRAAMRCADLTRGLLAFSRRLGGQPQRVVLNAAVAETLDLVRRTIPATIHIQSFLEPALWPASCDVGQIQQVLMNLCVNARDAMPQGGILTVTTRNIVVTEAELAMRGHDARAGEFIEITASDTGTGIIAEFMPRIFEPFFTTKRVGEATGLGLAMAYGLTVSHGGWIEVESEPGRGSAFRVYLPRVTEPDEPPPPERAATRALGRGETVLVVEDEAIVRGMVSRILESSGYRVISAPDGDQALAEFAANRDRIGLVLLDLTMPGLPGLVVLSRLRELDPAATVVLTSGYAMEATGGFTARGAAAFLAKPYPAATLLSLVRDLLDRRG